MLQPTSAGLSTEDIAAIRRGSVEWLRCVLARDYEGVANWYTEDAVVMPPHHPAVRGRSAIREWAVEFPRAMQFTFEIEQIEGRADLAYVRGMFCMTFQPEGAPKPLEEVGKYIEIRKRQSDGSWRLAVDIFNSDK